MKLELWWIGETSSRSIKSIIDEYHRRIRRFHPLEVKTFKASKQKDPEQSKKEEADQILRHLQPGDFLCLLDEKGEALSSKGLARFLENKSVTVPRKCIFLTGGAYGFDERLYDRSDHQLSLSRMTFTHEMVRIFFIEQVYRAFTILHNLPYHHA